MNATTDRTALSTVFSVRARLDAAAPAIAFAALGVVFLWFGAMKFTAYEAAAIEGLIANSPLISWLLGIASAGTAAALIGVVEIAIALLLFARFVAPAAAAVGAAGASVTFALTLTFFFTTPGVFLPDVGALAISVVPGQFLLKDLALLALSVWALADALGSAAARRR